MFGRKYEFYNPVKQNEAHILALSKQLGVNLNKFISIIVFSNSANLKINTRYNVVYANQINIAITEYSDVQFSENDIQKIYNKVFSLNITSSKAKRKHIQEVQNIVKTKQNLLLQGIYPRCKHRLILRNGKYGDFFACSNYPDCKFIKPIKYSRNNKLLDKLSTKLIKKIIK